MKILHVETGKHLYGGAKQVTYLIEGLNQRGLDNVLCAPKGSDIAHWAESTSIGLCATDSAGDLDLRFYRQLRRIMCQQKPDIVHLHSRRGADVLGGIAAQRENIPCILSRRVDNREHPLLARLKYRLYDHVITISQGILQVLLDVGIPADKMTCVHSAVDAAQYQNPASKVAFQQEFDLSDDAFSIGVVAQLIKRKGHRYLFQVLPQLIEQHPEIRVLIFGKGPLEQELRQQVQDAGLTQHVTFTGFRNDLDRWMGCLDLLVHPADIEGLGVSLLQAAAAGVPIIASRAGGMPEIVHHEQNGLLIEPGDPQALQQAIQRLIQQPGTRQHMQQQAPAIVAQHFSIDAMVDGNLRIYQQILANN